MSVVAYLFSNETEKERASDACGWGGGEDLGGPEKGNHEQNTLYEKKRKFISKFKKRRDVLQIPVVLYT